MKTTGVLASMTFLVCIIIGCHEKKAAGTLSVIKPLTFSRDFDTFDDIVDSVKLISLDSSVILSNFLGKIYFTEKGEILAISNKSIILFDRNGSLVFKKQIAGKGPGEVLHLRDFCYANQSNTVLVLNHLDEVFEYSATDGSFIRKINIENKKSMPGANEICSSGTGTFYLFFPNPANVEDLDESKDFYCLYEYDMQGKIIDKYLRYKEFCISIFRFSNTRDNTVFIRPLEGENVLRVIRENKVEDFMEIDFGEQSCPPGLIYTFPGNPWLNIQKYLRADCYKMPTRFYDTKEFLYFNCAGPNAKEHYFLFNKKRDMNSFSWIGYDPFEIIASDQEWFYGVIRDYVVPESDDNGKSLNDYIIRRLNLPRDFNPNRLVKIKFKNISDS